MESSKLSNERSFTHARDLNIRAANQFWKDTTSGGSEGTIIGSKAVSGFNLNVQTDFLEHDLTIRNVRVRAEKALEVNLKIKPPFEDRFPPARQEKGRLTFILNDGTEHCVELKFGRYFEVDDPASHTFKAYGKYPVFERLDQSISSLRLFYTMQKYPSAIETNANPPARSNDARGSETRNDFGCVEFFLQQKPDLTIICGAESWLVHKAVLIENSSVFDDNITESSSGSSQLDLSETEISPKSVFQLLRFLYTGKMEESWDVCLDLFYTAGLYGIKGLKSRCEEYLVREVKPENAVELYTFGNHHRGPLLREAALRVIKKHKAEVFPDLKSWKDFIAKFPDISFKLFLET